VQVLVRDNNVEQALKVLEKAEAIRRARKLARKKLQREGPLPMKPRVIPRGPWRRRSRARPSLLISQQP